GDGDWEAAVVTAHYRLSRCKTAVDDPSDEAVDEWDEKHEAFHAALLSAATSSWLLHFRSTIADQLRRHHRFLGLSPTLRAAAGMKDGYEAAVAALREAIAIDSHTELMQAALDRDVERSKALMAAHIGYTMHVYVHSADDGRPASGGMKARPAAE
ncbi:FCD domain-containing protein, partial [Rhizobiaceae sp. 2RAB30]